MSALPGGTITFLFTDMEGSTRRWDQYPQVMMGALSRHNTLLNSVIEQYGGVTFKTVGDAVYAAFSDSASACQAAIAAQRALQSEDWGDVGPVLIRMALHSGTAEEREADYFGPTVNRVARLVSAAHGGQILLTQRTFQLAREHLPEGVEVRDFGERRLKDLSQPEHVLQLVAPGLPSDFPPLNTLDIVPNNLPVQPTPFIGRAELVKSATGALRHGASRLLTLVGPGGAGKTRIGLQIAAGLVDEFEDGVFLVGLSPVMDPELVAPAIAQTLHVKELSGRPIADILKEHLHNKHILLVLDNFEQVAPASLLVSDLLNTCPDLRIVVTSRAALRIYGEEQIQVPPMSLPESVEHLSPESLRKYEAIELFVERAQAVKPDFALTEENTPYVVDICRQLDGLPLAIELAAARTRVLSLHAICSRLSDKLGLLTQGPRDLPARQQTLRGTIQWSYELLDEEERALLRRTAVFVRGCTLAAMEEVSGWPGGRIPRSPGPGDVPVPHSCVLDLATSLADKSLLRSEESLGEPRFSMLSTIREFMLERLVESGEEQEIRRRHAGYFLSLAETAEPFIKSGVRQAWIEQLHVEHNNLVAALEWCQSERGERETGLRLAGALHWFWYFKGYLAEGREWLERALATEAGRAPTQAVARALDAAGRLAMLQNDREAAGSRLAQAIDLWRRLGARQGLAYSLSSMGIATVFWNESADGVQMLTEAEALFRHVGDRWGLAFSLDLQAEAHVLLGDLDEGMRCYQGSLALFRHLADSWGVAAELGELARLDIRRGNYAEARAKLEESLSSGRLAGDRWNTAHCLRSLGDVAYCLGDMAQAHARYEEAIDHYRSLGDQMRRAACIRSLGHVARRQGDVANARALYLHSLGVASEIGALPTLAWCFSAIAGLCGEYGDPERAATLFGASRTLANLTGAFIPPADKVRYEDDLNAVRSYLGEQRFEELFAAGEALSRENATEEAHMAVYVPLGNEPEQPVASPANPAGLNDREMEVLRLVAAGVSNAHVAEQLALSPHTVQAHLYSIFSKIGATSRDEVIGYAGEHGPVT